MVPAVVLRGIAGCVAITSSFRAMGIGCLFILLFRLFLLWYEYNASQ